MPAFKTFDSKVLDIIELSATVKHFVLSVPDDFVFRSGQFVSAIIPFETGTIRRPYSIASSPHKKGCIELCIKKVEEGRVSVYFHKLQKDQMIKIMGPLGDFKIKNPTAETVFIATGTGIAPLRGMAQTMLLEGANQKILMLTGSRFEDEILYSNEHKELMRMHPNYSWHHIVSRPGPTYTGEVGRVQALIEKYVAADFAGDYYLCGLWPMIEETTKMLAEKGVAKERMMYERYS